MSQISNLKSQFGFLGPTLASLCLGVRICFSLGFFAVSAFGDAGFPATTQPGTENGLPWGVWINQQAPTFDELAKKTKPDFIWNGHDMLWITSDPEGSPVFTMDSAYKLQLDKRRSAYCLLETDRSTYACDMYDDYEFGYTRAIDRNPTVMASDPKRGVVYQARWISEESSGSGGDLQTRNILLLCDAQHHWHLLGDGPIAESGAGGADNWSFETLETDVRWTGDAAHPAELSFTLLTTYEWNLDDPNDFTMTVSRAMVPATKDSSLNAYWRFQPQGHYYILAMKSEPLADFARRVAHCGGLDLRGLLPEQKQNQIYQAVEAALKEINPALSNSVTAGAKIILPDKLYHHYGDIKQWLPSQSPPPTTRPIASP